MNAKPLPSLAAGTTGIIPAEPGADRPMRSWGWSALGGALLLTACAAPLPPYDPNAPVRGAAPVTTLPGPSAQQPVPQPYPAPPPAYPASGYPAPTYPGVVTEPIPQPQTVPPAQPPVWQQQEPLPAPFDPQAQQMPVPQPPVVQEFVCNADPAQSAVGQPYSPALLNQIRERTGARGVRVLQPGQATTMEFNAQRANLVLDADNKVEAVRCG